MSKINLPPLPPLPEQTIIDVIPCDEGDWPIDGWDEDKLRTWAIAYAEQAVREALAAQEPVAWLREVTPGGGVWRHYVSLEEPTCGFPAIERKHSLAIIPENGHGEST